MASEFDRETLLSIGWFPENTVTQSKLIKT